MWFLNFLELSIAKLLGFKMHSLNHFTYIMYQVYKYMCESVSHCEYILLFIKQLMFVHFFRYSSISTTGVLLSSVFINTYRIYNSWYTIINEVRLIRNQLIN